jgi:16S rRNA (cytidine1402-2'-O)-methyltransferase
VLREADVIAAEDTRHTRKLLARHEIRTPLLAYHAHSGTAGLETVLERLQRGAAVALVTDAGTPGISDPGGELVAAASAAGVTVTPVPGPSALTAALSVAGLVTSRFAFEGFLPRTAGERRRRLAGYAADPRALVLYEAPGRLVGTLKLVDELLGDRPLTVARELTKLHEELFRGTAAEACARFAEAPPRGECVVVIQGATGSAPTPAGDELDRIAGRLLAEGLSERDAARRLAEDRRIPRREAYAAVLRARDQA